MVKKEIVEAINDSPYKVYMAVTGGGTGFIGDFLKFGGGSQTILGYEVPYHPVAMDKYVGQKLTKYCSQEAAIGLSNTSFFKALDIAQTAVLSVSLNKLIGIGVTASLRKPEGERDGRWNGAYISINVGSDLLNSTVEFTEGTREEQEEQLVDEILTKLYEAVSNDS